MPNEYSIEIHNYITEQISVHEQKARETVSSQAEKQCCLGRLHELRWIRSYLAEHIDLKDFPYY